MQGKKILVAGALVAGLGAAACGRTIVVSPAANPTVTETRSAAPAPTVTIVQPPASAPPSSYAQDITNAGIVAPVAWINSTGERLCAEWRAGSTTATTDGILLSGGIHQNHLDAFNRITNADLCPDVTP